MMEPDPVSTEQIVGFLRESQLTPGQVEVVLTGMYPEYRDTVERLL